MGVELQFDLNIFKILLARDVQAKLRATSLDPVNDAYVDHADVANGPVESVTAGANVNFRVPLDVYVTLRAAILAAPNGVPQGATQPVQAIIPGGPPILVLGLSVSGTVLSLTCADVELGALGNVPGVPADQIKSTVKDAVGAIGSVDLSGSLQSIGLPAVTSSSVALGADVVSIRFDAQGDVVRRLQPGQEWGLFFDAAAAEGLIASQLKGAIGSLPLPLAVTTHWAPAGSSPHIDVHGHGSVQVPAPFTATADVYMGCDLSLKGGSARWLRIDIGWSLQVHLGDLVPAFVENYVEDQLAEALDPSMFGGVPTGTRAFAVEKLLPALAFGGAGLNYDSILATPEGMTLGGGVRLPADIDRSVLEPKLSRFTRPYILFTCRSLAATGSGNPPGTVSLSQVRTNAQIWLANCGAFGGSEYVSPGNWIAPYVDQPAEDTVGEQQHIDISIPSLQALGITSPVRIIVRTARGVRLLDLGIPPKAEVDAQGNVTNVIIDYIDNCLYFSGGHGHRIQWGSLTRENLDPPLEHPDWTTFIRAGHGFEVQMVHVGGLEAGELLQFRSGTHAVDVTANASGEALIPVLLQLDAGMEPAQLSRVNQRSLAGGRLAVSSAMFLKRASLPAAAMFDVARTSRSRARMLAPGDLEMTRGFDVGLRGGIPAERPQLRMRRAPNPAALPFAEPAQKGAGRETQALPPLPSPSSLGLADVGALKRVPGFDSAPIAFAEAERGRYLLIDLSTPDAPRVAGMFAGPLEEVQVLSDWAVVPASDRSTLFELAQL